MHGAVSLSSCYYVPNTIYWEHYFLMIGERKSYHRIAVSLHNYMKCQACLIYKIIPRNFVPASEVADCVSSLQMNWRSWNRSGWHWRPQSKTMRARRGREASGACLRKPAS